jgi:AcrR family transcriptional regulator
MARVVKDYDERHAEFLDVAQTLFLSKGYQRTSVQEIIKTVGVAKGTFYHYFDSKADILDALVKRMAEQIVASLEPMLNDETLNAIQKLEQFFAQINQWKIAKKELMLDTARVLYHDDNILLRGKSQEQTIRNASPLLAKVIQQGVEEGVFNVAYPQETAEMVIMMGRTLSESLIPFLLSEQREDSEIERIKRHVLVYNESINRVLGMSQGSLELISMDDLTAWF